MKKLVYILSLAIGLLMTGCAQWETMESLPRDTWGPEPELAIEIAPLDSVTGELISDVMEVVFYVKNATLFQFVYAEGPAQEIDYTSLLKGLYGGYSAEPNVEGDTLGIKLPGMEPGKTYTVYAVAVNEAGVQTTAYKTVGAVDVTAPYYTASNAESLKHSNKGKQVTVAFNENIVRTDDMPAVTFEVYEFVDDYVLYAQGTASAMASGKNLVVTLPADFEFKAETLSVVLLSFAEGAVEDMYGNKMAAVTNGFDESGLPNALWWSYEDKGNSGEVTTGEFFAEGEYFFKVYFEEKGEQYEGDLGVEFALQSDSYDLTQLFGQNAPAQTGIEWSVSGLLSSMYNGVTDKAFPAISFKYEYQGNSFEDAVMIDATDKSGTCIGTMDVMGDGTQSNAYIGYVDGQSGQLQLYWHFSLADENQNTDAPVEDLMGWFVGGGAPRILVYGNFGQGEGYYTLMEFDEIYLMRDGGLDAANVTVFDKPVKVDAPVAPFSFDKLNMNFAR